MQIRQKKNLQATLIDLINKTPFSIQKNNDRTKLIGGHLFASLDGLISTIARLSKEVSFFQ